MCGDPAKQMAAREASFLAELQRAPYAAVSAAATADFWANVERVDAAFRETAAAPGRRIRPTKTGDAIAAFAPVPPSLPA